MRPEGLPPLGASPLLPRASAGCPLVTSGRRRGPHEPLPTTPSRRRRHVSRMYNQAAEARPTAGHGPPKGTDRKRKCASDVLPGGRGARSRGSRFRASE